MQKSSIRRRNQRIFLKEKRFGDRKHNKQYADLFYSKLAYIDVFGILHFNFQELGRQLLGVEPMPKSRFVVCPE